ncbi:MAG TPA: hypothetical protein VH480_18265 [Streptosporangiaceae bacterium]|jgi:hypothetical protein
MRVAPGRGASSASSWHALPVRHCWSASSGLLAAYAGSAAVTAVAALAGGTRHPAAALAAYGLLAAVVAASTRPAAAAGVALIAWMFDNGFIVGRHADLSWHGAADARRLAILLAAAAAAAMLGSHIRRVNQRLNPAPGQAIAVDVDQGIPDGHPPPVAHAPAAAAPGHHRSHR